MNVGLLVYAQYIGSKYLHLYHVGFCHLTIDILLTKQITFLKISHKESLKHSLKIFYQDAHLLYQDTVTKKILGIFKRNDFLVG